jgi:DNA-binding NarL/FixJ family response regulator
VSRRDTEYTAYVAARLTYLLAKLGAANRTEAAARARQLGPIP